MGISRDYHAPRRSPRRGKLGTALRLAGIAAAILLLSLAITAILEGSGPAAEETITLQPSGTVQEILAPLPMQGTGTDGTAQAVVANRGNANACGEDQVLAYTGQILALLRQALGEDCVIYVQSIPPVRPSAAAEKPGLASDNLRAVNERLAHLADEKGCVYLDLWEPLADGEGNLKEVCAAPDGVHLSAGNGYGAWVTYLRNHAKYDAHNAWGPGSAVAR